MCKGALESVDTEFTHRDARDLIELFVSFDLGLKRKDLLRGKDVGHLLQNVEVVCVDHLRGKGRSGQNGAQRCLSATYLAMFVWFLQKEIYISRQNKHTRA
jgi:hypothetical protein